MSAAGRGAERRADDFYATPSWATRAILADLFLLGRPRGRVLEPAAGDGAIVDELRAFGVPSDEIDAFELNPGRAAASNAICTDFLKIEPDPLYGLVITNPPYSLALEFAQHGAKFVREGGELVLLTRLNWLASQRRASWLRDMTPSVYVLPKRPSFTGKGTDATDYAWMVWSRADTGTCGSAWAWKAPTVRILNIAPASAVAEAAE